jgi:hypothetical protein
VESEVKKQWREREERKKKGPGQKARSVGGKKEEEGNGRAS